MYKKSLFTVLLALLSCTVALKAQSNSVIDVIMAGYSAKMFTTKPVTDGQIDLIVKCGLKAPSARNSQMWKFTVVKDSTIANDIVRNMTSGNILIIVSGQEAKQEGLNADFDCALAIENMYIAAQSLGLGAHIYGSPVNMINNNKKALLGIPEGYRAVSVLRIGNIKPGVDATSSASTRKTADEMVNYK